MSYPFGFDVDPRGFYFRSVYLPAVLLFVAVLVAVYDAHKSVSVRARTMLTAAFFCTVTMLYQFEYDGVRWSYWGLVDGFLAGGAALAAAAAWRGTQSKSSPWGWLWTIVAALASCLGVLVKPSGTMVAAIVGAAWGLFALVRIASNWSSANCRPIILRLFGGTVAIGAMDGLVVSAALSSRYLSHENMQWGLATIAVNRAELRLPLNQLLPVVNDGLGGQFLLWIVLSVALLLLAWKRAKHADKPAGALAATVVEVEIGPKKAVRVRRVVEAFECGAVVNPNELRNQIQGAIMMGIGGALFETVRFDNGRILNPQFPEYRVPRFADMPQIEVVLVDRKDRPSAGAGETPIVGVAPAIANAIFAATGNRLRTLPLQS